MEQFLTKSAFCLVKFSAVGKMSLIVSKDVAAEIRFAVFEVHQSEQAEYLACNFSVFRFLLRRTKS